GVGGVAGRGAAGGEGECPEGGGGVREAGGGGGGDRHERTPWGGGAAVGGGEFLGACGDGGEGVRVVVGVGVLGGGGEALGEGAERAAAGEGRDVGEERIGEDQIGGLVGVGTKGAGHRQAGDALDGGGGREQIAGELAVVVGRTQRIEDERVRGRGEERAADAAVVQAAGVAHEGAEQRGFGAGVDEGWGRLGHLGAADAAGEEGALARRSHRFFSSSGRSSWPQ